MLDKQSQDSNLDQCKQTFPPGTADTHTQIHDLAYSSTEYKYIKINASAVLPNGKFLSVAESCMSRDGQQIQKNGGHTQSIRSSRPKNFPDLREWSCGKKQIHTYYETKYKAEKKK